jgi:hypothetical protein
MPRSINAWALLRESGWNPHPGQVQVFASSARHRVVSAGRRFGKSDLGGHELLPEVFLAYSMARELREAGKRREFWIVGPEYGDSEKEFRVIWNDLNRLQVPFDKPGSYNDPIGMNMHISLWGGAFQIHAKSAKHPETLIGEGLHGVILAEAAKLKEVVWTRFIRPTLADHNGWSLHTSTPEGRNWFYESWKRGQDPRNPDWASWKMPSWNNPHVYRTPTRTEDVLYLQDLLDSDEALEYSIYELIEKYELEIDPEIVSLLNDLTEESFNQEIGADFTEFVGRVFKLFDEETHVFDLKFNPSWRTYAGVDLGFTNPSVWLLLQVGPWGDVHVLDEFYQSTLTANEFADQVSLRGLAPSSMLGFYSDPASPGDNKIIAEALKVKSVGGTGGEIKHRLDAIRGKLKLVPPHLPAGHPEKLPKIRIDRCCTELIREMGAYRYPSKRAEVNSNKVDTNNAEVPLKKDDHGPEALGRFMAGFFGTPQKTTHRRRTHKVNIKR